MMNDRKVTISSIVMDSESITIPRWIDSSPAETKSTANGPGPSFTATSVARRSKKP